MPWKDKSKFKAYLKRYYSNTENLARRNEYLARYREENREKIRLWHDGAAHRKELLSRGIARGNTTTSVYDDVIKQGFPKDRFRLLCHNCNCARGYYGYCPHEKEKE
jgi:hypothetical protein